MVLVPTESYTFGHEGQKTGEESREDARKKATYSRISGNSGADNLLASLDFARKIDLRFCRIPRLNHRELNVPRPSIFWICCENR
jgi:hypothetical protein